MNITKSDFLDFVEKVKEKALKAIKSKYDPLIEKAREDALNADPLISKSIKEAESALALAKDKLDNIIARASELNLEPKYCYQSLTRKVNTIECMKDDIKNAFINSYVIKSACSLEEEKEAKISEVRIAYSSISLKIRRMSSKKNMLEFLKGLGFDTSSLEKPTKVKFDKETLFPCRYLNEDKLNDNEEGSTELEDK